MLLLLYLVSKTNQKNSLLISPSSAGLGSSGPSSVFAGVSQLKKLLEEETRGQELRTTAYVQAPLEAFSNIFLRSASFTDEGFLLKSKTSGPCTTFIMSQIIGISELSDTRSKEFCYITVS